MDKLDSSFYSDFKSYELEFSLRAYETATVQPFFGTAERGALLNLINDHLPDLADELHNRNDIRPYSLTPLAFNNHFLLPFKGSTIKILSGSIYTFKLKVLSNHVFQQLVSVFLNSPNKKITFFELDFLIESIHISNRPLLNIFPPEIQSPDQVHSPNAWKLFFHSPTQFKSKFDTIIPFPLPQYLFNNLFHTWRSFLQVPHFITQENWFPYLDQQLYVRQHKIRTLQLRFGKHSNEIGFIGSCLIVSKDSNNPINSFLTALLQLGETMNVGSKRSLGFGVMSYEIQVPKE